MWDFISHVTEGVFCGPVSSFVQRIVPSSSENVQTIINKCILNIWTNHQCLLSDKYWTRSKCAGLPCIAIHPVVDDIHCLLIKADISRMTSHSISNMWSCGGLLNSSVLFWTPVMWILVHLIVSHKSFTAFLYFHSFSFLYLFLMLWLDKFLSLFSVFWSFLHLNLVFCWSFLLYF